MNSVLKLTPVQRAELFNAAAQELDIGPVSLEKDFWVCWTLRELFSLPGIGEHLIFKGGTSLSKVWRAIQRFSEDLAISLSREWLGFGGNQDPERQKSRKKRGRKLEELAAACARKIHDNLLPALHIRATAALGERGWFWGEFAGAFELDARLRPSNGLWRGSLRSLHPRPGNPWLDWLAAPSRSSEERRLACQP